MTNYRDEFSKISKSILKVWEIIDANLSINNQLQDLIEIQNKINGSLVPIIENTVKDPFKNLSSTIQNLQKSMEDFPISFQESLKILANNGWFLDLQMPIPFTQKIADFLENGKHEEAEVILIQYFQNRLSNISENLISNHQNRSKILKSAFYAHENSLFDLSIPVFLAQADGICYETVKKYYFIKSNKKPSTSKFVDTLNTTNFRKALLYPLTETFPVSASEKERGENFNELNRHQIIHGEVFDYGTELNSLKSISLLNYISQVLTLDD